MNTKISLLAAFALLVGFAAPADASTWRIDFDSADLLSPGLGSDGEEGVLFNGASQLYHGRIMDDEYAGGIPGINLEDGVSIFNDGPGGFTEEFDHDLHQKQFTTDGGTKLWGGEHSSTSSANVGVNISAKNYHGLSAQDVPDEGEFLSGPGNAGLPLLFNTHLWNTADTDLEDVFKAAGNPLDPGLDPNQRYRPGHILILSENFVGDDPGECDDDRCSPVNDEGSRPAGELIFVFDAPVDLVSLDLFDIEGTETDPPGEILFFSDADDDSSLFEIVGLPSTGDRKWNRVTFSPNITGVERMIVKLGGSGGIDNVVGRFTTQVAEPGSIGLFASGLAMLGIARHRRRKARADA